MKSRVWLLGLGIVAGLALTAAVWVLFPRAYTYQGSLIDPPVPAASINLGDQNGHPFRLDDQRGRIVLIFFGYTHCPDVCPATLSEYRQIKKLLGGSASQVRFMFITVDPQRDTQAYLKEYLGYFDPDLIGLTGSEAELEQVWKAYGVFRNVHPADASGNYLVDHSARTYLIDLDGNWRLTYPFGTQAEKVVADINHLLKED
jgi:protein SCO1/2